MEICYESRNIYANMNGEVMRITSITRTAAKEVQFYILQINDKLDIL